MFKLGEKPLQRPDAGSRHGERMILQLRVVLMKAIRRGLRRVVVIEVIKVTIDELVKIRLSRPRAGGPNANRDDEQQPSHTSFQSNKRPYSPGVSASGHWKNLLRSTSDGSRSRSHPHGRGD